MLQAEPAGHSMATISTVTRPSAASAESVRQPGMLREIADFFRDFIVAAFDPYRPELHYMRGPGPACAAKRDARN